MTTSIPSVPKSICKDVAIPVAEFYKTVQVINYSQPCLSLKNVQDLTALRTFVAQSLRVKYNNDYAKSAVALLTLKNVNAWLKKDHKNGIQTPADAVKEREFKKMSNEAAKIRKERTAIEEKEKKDALEVILKDLSEKADLADKVVARVRDWCSLLFIQDQSIEGIILSTVSEQALLTLKTDVDEVFRELRGAASISCPRCRGIVLELEKIMKLLRTHKCVAHLSLFLSIAMPTPPSSNTAAIAPLLPAKKRRGTTKGDLKWRVGDLMGGLKI